MSTLDLFRILLWARVRTLKAGIVGLREKSRLMVFVLAAFILGYLGLGYWLFRLGLDYLYHFPLVGALFTQRILFLIFGFVFVMLIFSNLIIGYASLFKNQETNWMLSLPVKHQSIYRWKFLESLAVSSWALLFLSAPLMAAWGHVHHVEWWFYPAVLVGFIPFVVLPGLVGSWLILLMVRFLSRVWVKRVLIGAGVVTLLVLTIFVHPVTGDDTAAVPDVLSFDKLLKHSRIALNPFLPSAWLSESVLALGENLPTRAAFYSLVLWSYALMGLVVGFGWMSRFYYGSFVASYGNRAARMQQRAAQRRRVGPERSRFEQFFDALPFGTRSAKAMSMKDIRVFWREPAQWSQFMIFFGLLCIYVLNLRNIAVDFRSPFWEMMISYLNLAASSLTLSTLTTRFIFPQFSLEGRRLWIIGLAPLGLRKVLVQKLALAVVASATITITLMIVSSGMLNLPWKRMLFFASGIGTMSMTLCAMAVGLGAIFPNLREDNPSKIVSGFGGTLCLVLSFLYIMGFIALLMIPGLRRVTKLTLFVSDPVAIGLAVLLSVIAGGLPFFLALRRVKNLEI